MTLVMVFSLTPQEAGLVDMSVRIFTTVYPTHVPVDRNFSLMAKAKLILIHEIGVELGENYLC